VKKIFFAIVTVFFISACDDTSIVNVYDKSILKSQISCLKLMLHPENKTLEKTMIQLYKFDEQCPYTLDISYKNSEI